MWAEGQMDMMKLIYAFQNFAKRRLIYVGIRRLLLLVITSADVVCVCNGAADFILHCSFQIYLFSDHL